MVNMTCVLDLGRALCCIAVRTNDCPHFYLFIHFIQLFGGVIISKKDLMINEEIRDKEVRVVDFDGSQLGVMPAGRAMELAMNKNMDLVKIAPQASPPVCKIMDYGKYKFEQAKREKEARKNQKVTEIKEVRLSLKIDTNDFNTKLKNGLKFLRNGDKLKVSIRFRGREMAHPELGTKVMTRFAEACAEEGVVDKIPKLEGRSMVMFITPKPPKPEKAGKSKAENEDQASREQLVQAEKS